MMSPEHGAPTSLHNNIPVSLLTPVSWRGADDAEICPAVDEAW